MPRLLVTGKWARREICTGKRAQERHWMSQPIVISSGPAVSAGFSSSKSQSSASDRDAVDAAPQSAAPQSAAPQHAAPRDVAPQEVAPESVAVICGTLRGRFLIAEERVLVEGAQCSLPLPRHTCRVVSCFLVQCLLSTAPAHTANQYYYTTCASPACFPGCRQRGREGAAPERV